MFDVFYLVLIAVLFVLSIAALAIWPRGTFSEVLVSRTPGGLLARRALTPVVLLPILLGFLRNAGEREGLFGDAMGTAMMASATVLALGFVVWQSARVLDRKDAAQRALAAENERLAREAQQAVRVRDEFIAIAAHELRTPLTSLRLQTQLDARRAGSSDWPAARRHSVRRIIGVLRTGRAARAWPGAAAGRGTAS